MDIIRVISVLWEWRVEVRIEPKKLVDLHEQWICYFLREVIRAFLLKTVLYVPVPRAGVGSQAKHSRCRLFPWSPFVLLIARRQGRGSRLLHQCTSTWSALMSIALGQRFSLWERCLPGAVSCCLMLLNNDQVFSSFFLLFFLLKFPPLWHSAFPSPIQSVVICLWTLFPRSLSGFGEDLLSICFSPTYFWDGQ